MAKTVKPASNIRRVTFQDIKDCFTDIKFYHMYVAVVIGYIYCHFVNFSFKKIGLDHIERSDQFINIAGSIGAIFNAGARPLIAIIYEKTSYKVAALLIVFIEVTSALIFIPAANNKATFTASLSYYFLTYGGQLGLYPLVCENLYPKKGALVYTITFSGFCLGALFIAFIYKPLMKDPGEGRLFLILSIVPLLPLYSIFVTDRNLKKAASERPN